MSSYFLGIGLGQEKYATLYHVSHGHTSTHITTPMITINQLQSTYYAANILNDLASFQYEVHRGLVTELPKITQLTIK